MGEDSRGTFNFGRGYSPMWDKRWRPLMSKSYALVLYVVNKLGSLKEILHHSPFMFDHPLKVRNDIAKEEASKVMYIPENPLSY